MYAEDDMARQPTLQTDRLILRPFASTDADDVQRLAGAKEIADTTLRIPHPYEDGVAEDWIASHPAQFDEGKLANFAIALRETGELVGSIGLTIKLQHQSAELGYWVGLPYWGRGYCTEAARAVLRYGFEQLGLNRIHAHHFARNPASGRVMEKIGMQREGLLRQAVRKQDAYEDLPAFAILKEDYERGLGSA